MAIENSLVLGDNYQGTQKDFNDDITTLCILCQDIINSVVIDKGCEDICVMDVFNAFERIKAFNPSLIARLDAKLNRVNIKSETGAYLPGVEYDVVIHNEKDQQKITYSVCC